MTTRNQLSRAQAISFDGDMTLWDFQTVMRHSLGYALRVLQARLPGQASAALTIDKMIEIRNVVAAELKGRVVNLEEIRFQAFVRTLEFVGSKDLDLATALNALYLQHRFEDIELYPDVVPTLDTLGPRYTLGLLSNGNGYPERCGLAGRFRFVVFAQDVGVEKPDPQVFEVACRQAGCQPGELVHVGDSLETDVRGAKSVGAMAVWLNRDGKPRELDIEPDLEIRSLIELKTHLKEVCGANDPLGR